MERIDIEGLSVLVFQRRRGLLVSDLLVSGFLDGNLTCHLVNLEARPHVTV